MTLTRRTVLSGSVGLAAAGLLARPSLAAGPARVVIIGGGFGGASVARYLKRHAPEVAVTLVEPKSDYVTCPFSNGVLGGLWPISRISFTYDRIRAAGIEVVHDTAAAIDAGGRSVKLTGGETLLYDRLVVSPGVQFVWTAIEGYDEKAAETMPHAWSAGPQTLLLRKQLEAMPDGGLVIIAVPDDPIRCPPGPYERASLIAHYLKTEKPRSKLKILDAKDSFAKQPLFEEAWKKLYPNIIEWVPGSQSGKVLSVDPASMKVSTGFDDFTPAVANIIPPQRAGKIAIDAGLDQGNGFCPVDATTFESKAQAGIYIVGDSTLAGAMPKSGFSANNQAAACAAAIVASLRGETVQPSKLLNICYSTVAPGYAFSIVDDFERRGDEIGLTFEEDRLSPLDAPEDVRRREADFAESWYDNITRDIFG